MPRGKKTDKEGVSKITIYKLDGGFSAEKALSGYKNQKDGILQGWNYRIFTRLKPNMPPSWKPLVKNLEMKKISLRILTRLWFSFSKKEKITLL